jgi:hypothetical protein
MQTPLPWQYAAPTAAEMWQDLEYTLDAHFADALNPGALAALRKKYGDQRVWQQYKALPARLCIYVRKGKPITKIAAFFCTSVEKNWDMPEPADAVTLAQYLTIANADAKRKAAAQQPTSPAEDDDDCIPF